MCFKLDDVTLVFKPNRKVLFVAIKQVSDELDRLETKMIKKVDYAKWAAPTESPWSRLYINFAGSVNGAYSLIIVDIYRKWPEVCKCNTTSEKTTIKFLFKLFVQYNVSNILVSGNGTQFMGKE